MSVVQDCGARPISLSANHAVPNVTAVPIKVHSAIEDKSVHFHQVHAKDGAQINQRRVCSEEGKEVPYKQVAKGYEVRGYRKLRDLRLLRKETLAEQGGVP